MSVVTDALEAATTPRPPGSSGAPARFAVELRDDQHADDVSATVRDTCAELAVTVSVLDAPVLVVEMPGRTFDGVSPAAAFSAAYVLADAVGAPAAEPDLPTAFFPEVDPAEPVQESLGGVPGCNVATEPELAADWALDTIRAREAWALSESLGRPAAGAGIVIAQPDTGVFPHPELEGVDRAGGFDTLDDDSDPTDPLDGFNPGHGTGTASVVVSPKSLTVIGSAPAARHMPIRAIESVIRVTQVSVAKAIDWAVRNDAHVITMSLGGIPSFSLHAALRRAVADNVIVLAAAGNCVRQVVWPARYGECIAVAGVNARDGQWPGSCRGSAVDISAPAQNVWRAARSGGAEQGQGTSFAVAMTAGVAAMWLAHHGRDALIAEAQARGETLQGMFMRLAKATARRPQGWNSGEMGAGIVDAAALLGADLGLGAGLETVTLAQGVAPAPAAGSVASLIAETVGAGAADSVDLHRFGPEIATAILSRALAAEDGLESPPPVRVSAELAAAVPDPELSRWLGIDRHTVPG
ncbi:S8 family peptidase [Mycobacterium sp. NPDC050041]|uniref:S8 family peptidase n=1 Tax=Mycobacterium sp. NPDC050041 TaxID=3364293 RepID=UPI003C2C475E